MTRAARHRLKRKLAQAHHNIDRSLEIMRELEELFRGDHPMLADGLLASATLCISAQEILEIFAFSAWEMDKSAFESYRT